MAWKFFKASTLCGSSAAARSQSKPQQPTARLFLFMDNLWHRTLHRLIRVSYFDRVTVRHAERLPDPGPILYIGLHRNGAVDGFTYKSICTRAVFMVAKQLRRSPIGCFFFSGIEVARDKDGDPAAAAINAAAMKECAKRLHDGGELFIFPEGTSALGPRHLPFKSGAARLIEQHLAIGAPLTVVPLGIFYESPTSFRARVELVVGEPLRTDLPANLSQPARVRELKQRITAALENVGVNVPDAETLAQIERLACIATLGTGRSFAATQKQLERGVPPAVEAAWRELEPVLTQHPLWLHQGVPLFPMSSLIVYALLLIPTGLLALLGVVLNLPPLAAAAWAGRKFPDDRNVVLLWKVLVGVPAFLLWAGTLLVAAAVSGHWLWLAVWLAATAVSTQLWYRVKKLAVVVHNGLRFPGLRARMLAFRELVLKEVRDEPA